MNRTWLPIVAALIASTALAGCSKTSTGGTGEGGRHPWTQPGVFRFSEFSDPKNLNPALNSASPTLDLSMFIYSWTVRYDDKARPYPDALSEIPTLENGDVSKDGLTLKYKLRHNMKWHDGQPVTCNDLKFTWQVVMNPHNNVITTDGYKDIGSIDCSDPYVAVIHMKKLYAPFLQQLWSVNGNSPILPEHILAKYNDDKGSLNTAPYNALPIGSGPFKVVQWQRGQEVRMEVNPDFYLGRPKLNEVIYKILPDENTVMTQVQTHEIDMLAIGSGLKWPEYAALAADPKNGLTAVRVDSYLWSHVDFNLKAPIVSDVQVRRALAYATDKNEIITKILHGSAIAADTDQSPKISWAYTNDIVHYPYDPAKAKALLDADGWHVGTDGVRVKNGQRLEFTLSTQTESTYGKALQTVLQRMWRDVGVQADVKNYPTSQFFDNSASGILQGGHYDVAGFSWIGAADPDDSAIYSGDNLAPKGQNAMFWNNRVATDAMNDALKTIDQARRKKDYAIVQQQLALDVPTIIINFARVPYVYNNDLKGFTPSPVISAFWDPWNYRSNDCDSHEELCEMNVSLARRLAFTAIAAILCACTKTGTGTVEGGRSNAWTHPHVLTISDAGDVNTLNPHLGQFADVGYLAQMTMAWLVKVDEHNNLTPELATELPTQANGGVSKDGLTITYHLRKGVKWSDGAPFDADDVVFSTNVVNNLANNEVGRQGWDQITKIDEPDKYTVVYHMKKPYSPFLETFFATAGANPCVLPKHLLAKYPNINNVPYNSLPVGIGPFKVKSWQRSDRVELVANPLYFRGRPKLDEVIFKIIPDRNTLLSQIQSHEVDMWYAVPGAYLSRVAPIEGTATLRQPSYWYNHLDFNVQRPALRDPAVRQALRFAINRPELRQKIGHGVGVLQDVTTPVTAPYAVTDLGLTPFDIPKANAILDRAGWRRGPDGIRAKDGVKMSFDFATSSGTPDSDNQIELIRSWWSQIGAQISVRHYPAALMFAPLESGGIVYSQKWDMIIFAWSNDAIGDYSAIYSCKAFPPAGQNNMRWCNQRAEAAMQALYTHFEQSQRNRDVHIFEEEYVKDVPSIVTSLREDIYSYNKDLKNYHPNAISPFDNMMDVDI